MTINLRAQLSWIDPLMATTVPSTMWINLTRGKQLYKIRAP